MKSRRSWLIGLALGAVLSFGAVNAQAQGPRLFSYQGLMLDASNNPVADGGHLVLVEILDGSGSNANILYQEQQTVTFTKGVFDVTIGVANTTPPNQLPLGIFNHPTWLKVTFEPGGANEHKFPPQQILSVPYAMNSELANGIQVSPSPVAGNIFPIPMVNGKIDPNFLPPSPASILSVNTVGPDNTGALSLKGNGAITVTNDAANHTITISGGSGQADTLTAGPGINVTPSINPDPVSGSRNRTISIQQGGLTNNMFGPGAISGSKISQIAGLGLAQDAAGLLNVQVDNQTLTIQNNQVQIAPGGVGTNQIANGAVNLANPNQKVNGVLPVANGGTGIPNISPNALMVGNGTNPVTLLPIGGNGTVLTSNGTSPAYAQLTTNATLLGNGTTTGFAINLANANTWTAAQTFPNINLTNTTNQINFGTGTLTTLTVPTPVAARTITLPDVGTNAAIVLNNSTNGQTIGSTAAGPTLTINSNGSLVTNPAVTINGTIIENGALTRTGGSTLNGNVAITGVTTQTGALNLAGAASPLQLNGANSLVGQLMVGNGAATPSWLPQGNAGQVLVSGGAGVAPTWGSLTFDKITNGTNTGNNALLVGNGSVLSTTGTGIINANQLNGVPFGPMTPTNGNILVANGTQWQSVPMSGDASIANTGALTLANTAAARNDIGLGAASAVTFGSLTLGAPLTVGNGGTGVATFGAGGILHSAGGTNNLTASAVNLASSDVTGTLPVANGGSGANTFAAGVLHANGTSAFTSSQVNLATEVTGTLSAANGGTGISNPAAGAILFGSGGNPMTSLPIGAANTFLMSNGTAPVWNNGGGAFILNQATTPGVQQAGANFNIGGTATISGGLNLAGAASPLMLNSAPGTSGQVLASAGPGATPTWINLATNIQPPTALNQTLRATSMTPPTWGPAGDLTNDGTNLTSTGNLTFTGTGGVIVSGTGGVSTQSGNISTASGNLVSGSAGTQGHLVLNDGGSFTATVQTAPALTASRTYTLVDPGTSAVNIITTNSPSGQTISNNTAGSPSLTIQSNGNSATNAGLAVTGTTTLTGALSETGASTFAGNITQTSGTTSVLNTTVTGTFTSTGNSTIGTNAGTVNTLGNNGGGSNSIGTGAGTLNNLGNSTGNTNIAGATTTITSTTNNINGATNVTGATTVSGSFTQTNGNVSMGTTAGNTTTIGNATGNNTINGATTTITSTTNNINGATNVTGATTVSGSFTQTNGNVSMGTTAGNTTTLGNSTGNTTINGATNAITGTTNNITGATNINTSGTAVTTIGAGTNQNWLTINGVNGGAVELQVNGDATITGNLVGGAGSFTTLTSTGNTTLATGAGTTNTFGAGTGAANTFGNATGTNIFNGTNTINGASTFNNTAAFGANNVSGSNFTITGGSITNTPISGSTGSFTTLASSGNTTLATGAGTTNTFGAGAGAANTIGNATGTNIINGTNTINGASTFNNTAAFGANNVSGSNFTITGGSITNTPISGSTGSFTTLNSSGNTTLATGAGTTNTFGAGTGAANTFGNATGTNILNGTNTINGASTFNNSAAFGANAVTGSNFQITGSTMSGTAITASTINSTPVGATTPSTGAFTTLSANNGLTVSAGGATITGTTTQNGALNLNGAASPLQANGSAGTAGQVLISGGAGTTPSWTTTPSAITVGFNQITTGTNTGQTLTVGNGSSLLPGGTGTITANQFVGTGSTTNAVDLGTAEVAGTLPVGNGGTGLGALAAGSLLYGSGASPMSTLGIGANGTILTSNGAAPAWQSGSGLFIQNQFAGAQSPASFWIAGNGRIDASNATPALQLTNSSTGGGLSVTAGVGNSAINVVSGTTSLLNTTVTGTLGVTGATTINTSGAAGTTIGNSGSTTAITGPTNINTSGTNVTSIGNTGGGSTQLAGVVTHTQGNVQFATTSGNFSAGNNGGTTTLSGNSVTVNGNTSFTNNVTVGGNTVLSGTTTANGATLVNSTLTSTGNSNIGTGAGTTNSMGNAGGTNNTIGGTNTSVNTLNGTTTATTTNATTDGVALVAQNHQSAASPYTADNGKYALSVLGGVQASSDQADGAGNSAAASQRYWADTYTLSVGDQASTSVTIFNSLVSATSTVLITVDGSVLTVNGLVTVSGISAGQFTVNTTAATLGGVNKIHYIVVNH